MLPGRVQALQQFVELAGQLRGDTYLQLRRQVEERPASAGVGPLQPGSEPASSGPAAECSLASAVA